MSDWRQASAAMSKQARRLEHDEWEKYVIGEAAKAAGKWLETQGGNLGRPVASLTTRDLERLSHTIVMRWIQLASYRVAEHPEGRDRLGWILMG